ncbi:hypothetical protein [Actinacidiphila yanglinensis]|uniref:hypothetical protein n=1 Tax=Actinacidiphila yanglinensis TaxID=310779 RepID=UPI00135C4CC4|nr:hypothetical protein [Actinacidiphila yanglinensis]
MRNPPVRRSRRSAGRPWRARVGWFLAGFVFVALCLGAGAAPGGHATSTATRW